MREDVWIWRYQVDGEVRTGKTLTRLRPLAIRRVQSAIDRELRKRGVPYASGIGGENLKAKTVRRICIIRHSAVPDFGELRGPLCGRPGIQVLLFRRCSGPAAEAGHPYQRTGSGAGRGVCSGGTG